MADMGKIFAARLERYSELYRRGRLTPMQYAALLNGLPYGKLEADEDTFESLGELAAKLTERLKR